MTVLAHGAETLHGLGAAGITTVVVLGVLHGLNPGMGWLFAVSYGLQERRRVAVVRALVPIGLGHEASVGLMAVAVVLFSSAVSQAVAVAVLALTMMCFGAWLFFRRRHFRWVGMNLSPFQLAWWSFLMSAVSGAGLMLAPVLVGGHAMGPDPLLSQALAGELVLAMTAAVLHATAMVLTSGIVAFAVLEILGLRFLTRAWINLDKLWAGAFLGAGAFVWLR